MSEAEAQQLRRMVRNVREIVERYGADSEDAAWAWKILQDALQLR